MARVVFVFFFVVVNFIRWNSERFFDTGVDVEMRS
jgi:hypothetical protein